MLINADHCPQGECCSSAMVYADCSGSTTARERLTADHPALQAGLGCILSWINPYRRRLRIPPEYSNPMEPSSVLLDESRRTD